MLPRVAEEGKGTFRVNDRTRKNTIDGLGDWHFVNLNQLSGILGEGIVLQCIRKEKMVLLLLRFGMSACEIRFNPCR